MKSLIFTLLVAGSLSSCGKMNKTGEKPMPPITAPTPSISEVEAQYCSLDRVNEVIANCLQTLSKVQINQALKRLMSWENRYEFFVAKQLHTQHFRDTYRNPGIGSCIEDILCGEDN